MWGSHEECPLRRKWMVLQYSLIRITLVALCERVKAHTWSSLILPGSTVTSRTAKSLDALKFFESAILNDPPPPGALVAGTLLHAKVYGFGTLLGITQSSSILAGGTVPRKNVIPQDQTKSDSRDQRTIVRVDPHRRDVVEHSRVGPAEVLGQSQLGCLLEPVAEGELAVSDI